MAAQAPEVDHRLRLRELAGLAIGMHLPAVATHDSAANAPAVHANAENDLIQQMTTTQIGLNGHSRALSGFLIPMADSEVVVEPPETSQHCVEMIATSATTIFVARSQSIQTVERGYLPRSRSRR